ncbi:glycoside hydrolase family 16 protein [Niabella sp. 22666]|uniref:glycoside hydrolase family 16 protein n=1 Tax=Niabella sp. 22666 TaxID=3453954 RepID=UPI003F84541D
MKRLLFLITLSLLSITSIAQTAPRKLVWSDEFNYKGLPDSTKWDYDFGSNNGWGNNELQYYTKDKKNARVEKGHLIIEARKEKIEKFNYTSARLVTKGKASWSQGRIEVRAKLPAGRGSWPAIWMLAENMKQWPDDGEIDIMEHVGYDPGWVHGSIHSKKYNHVIGTQKTAKTFVADFSKAFHVYSVEWDPKLLTVSIDGKPFFSCSNEQKGYEYWPFDNKMSLLLNIAVGGNWGGQKGVDDTKFPLRMEVDYVRVYQ